MASTPKIVSTPIKWAFKKLLHHFLLRFPGGDPHDPIACVYCPEMCRFSCPTAIASANDAVTPCNKMSLIYKERRWPELMKRRGELWPLYDCTGCGRCTQYCVYGVPVGDHLFGARKTHPWALALSAASNLTDQDDPVGDLADELGDRASAEKRLMAFLSREYREPKDKIAVTEPRSLYFLKSNNVNTGRLAWWDGIRDGIKNNEDKAIVAHLKNKRWLFHESVWFSRRLERSSEIDAWIKRAQDGGVNIVRPSAHGTDCMDCGGEGAYGRLFPSEAGRMAIDFWERDKARADGIICFSLRCASHLRAVLGDGVPVLALPEFIPELFRDGPTQYTKYCVIVNPSASCGGLGKRWNGLKKDVLAALGLAVDGGGNGGGDAVRVVFTTPTEHGAAFIRKAIQDGVEKIIVIGGDGTVSEAVQGLLAIHNSGTALSDTVLAILPAGRGNDFFKSIDGTSKHRAWQRALELLKSGKATPTDAGRVEFIGSGHSLGGRYFINIASFGYPGLVVKNVQISQKSGSFAYILKSITSLFEYKPVLMRVIVDGAVFYEGPIFSGFVLNGRYNGGGYCWVKDAAIDDGLFHVVIFEPRSLFKTLWTYPRMFSGVWDGIKGVHIARGKEIIVQVTDAKLPAHPLVEIDGELPDGGGIDEMRFKILKGAIKLWR